MDFSTLGLCDSILSAVAKKGYQTPSPIQAQAIPAILNGDDVMAAAQTGTGKTAGFTLPILERLSKGTPARANQVRALILTPTRELAAQVAQSVADYGKDINLRSAVVFGGVKINPQMMKLRKGADILIATPGRLLDLAQQNAVRFDKLEILVLDEADRMLDMGFIHDIKRIMSRLPQNRQTLMFSATFSNDIRKLAKGLVNNPVEISVTPRNTTVQAISQWLYPVNQKRKAALLRHLLFEHKWNQVLVFTRTKHGANKLAAFLESEGIPTAAIHGNKSQGARTRALADFKNGEVSVLVATDIAARGIDIDQLPQVVNFDLPNVPEDYVHRIGRTGRAGASGQAVSLVSANELAELSDIENLIKQLIERRVANGFEHAETLAETQLGVRVKRPKKPSNGSGRRRSGGASQGRSEKSKSTKNNGNRKKSSANKKRSADVNGNTSSSNGNTSSEKWRKRYA
jgi:ATP-dependent RNA helicase RhlE